MTEAPLRSLKVFLCHSSHDKPAVRELYRRLCDEGWIDVWLDEMKLLPGAEWDLEIEKAVESADIVLVCLSTHSVDKEGYVQKELRFVLNIAEEKPEGSLFVIPLRLDECIVPRRLRHWQWVDYFPKERQPIAYIRLLESLKVRAQKLGIPFEKPSQEPDPDLVIQLPPQKEEPLSKPDPASQKNHKPTISVPSSSSKKGTNSTLRQVTGLSLFLLVFFLSWLIPRFSNQPPVTTTTQTTTTSQIPTQTITLTATMPPVPTVNVVFLPPQTGEDGMTLLYVPAGNFVMGSDNSNPDEKPAHTVFLDAFWIDKTEVTNQQYSLCVQDGVCKEPTQKTSATRPDYYGNPLFDSFPVIYVDWYMAKSYCEWVGRRLPSEAEWEKAASWDVRNQHKNTYPWGDSMEYCSLANSSSQSGLPCVGDTTEVGKYRDGASPYAVLDMAGNVWEWVDDWYDAYPGNTASNAGYGTINRVLRGSAWVSNFPSTYRYRSSPAYTQQYIGFRCAMDATP